MKKLLNSSKFSSSKNIGTFIKAISIVIFIFTIFSPNQAIAQNPPVNSPPIQRIIEEEGGETFSQPSVENRGSNAGAVYGLLAAGLVLIAAGAGYLFWINSRIKSQ